MTQESADEGIEYGVFWGDSLFAHAKRKAPIIDHFLYVNDTIFINAQTGVGKSIFLLQMLASLTTGESFLGAFKIHGPKNVLLLQTEGDRVETLQRLNAIGRGVRIDHDRWVHVNLDGICLNTQQGLNDFMKMIEAPGINYDVVIIDPLYTTVKGSLSSDDVATDWIRSARAIRRKYQCAFAVSHHDTIKTQYYEGQVLQQSSKNLMGSSYWGAFTSYNFKLTLRNGIYTLTSGKERNPQVIDTIHMRLIEPDPLMFVMADETYNMSEAQILKVIEEAEETVGVNEVMQATKLSRATCYRAFRSLVDAGKIEKESKGHKVAYRKLDEK